MHGPKVSRRLSETNVKKTLLFFLLLQSSINLIVLKTMPHALIDDKNS